MSKGNAHQCRVSLVQLLKDQTGRLQAIDIYLGEIKNKIVENDTTALNTLLEKSGSPLADLQPMENERHALLTSQGFEVSKAGMELCIDWCDSQGQLKQQYDIFTLALSQLQHSIQVNALLVNKSKVRVRRSLHILTGQGNENNSKTYSRSGQTQAGPSKRSITLA